MEATEVAAERVEQKRRSRLVDFLSRLAREQPLGTVGGIIVLLLLFCGIFADILAPYGNERNSPGGQVGPRLHGNTCWVPTSWGETSSAESSTGHAFR